MPEYSDYSRLLFEGDIVLSPKQADSILQTALADSEKVKKRAAMLTELGSDGHNYRWTFPIPYYYHNSLSNSLINVPRVFHTLIEIRSG